MLRRRSFCKPSSSRWSKKVMLTNKYDETLIESWVGFDSQIDSNEVEEIIFPSMYKKEQFNGTVYAT